MFPTWCTCHHTICIQETESAKHSLAFITKQNEDKHTLGIKQNTERHPLETNSFVNFPDHHVTHEGALSPITETLQEYLGIVRSDSGGMPENNGQMKQPTRVRLLGTYNGDCCASSSPPVTSPETSPETTPEPQTSPETSPGDLNIMHNESIKLSKVTTEPVQNLGLPMELDEQQEEGETDKPAQAVSLSLVQQLEQFSFMPATTEEPSLQQPLAPLEGGDSDSMHTHPTLDDTEPSSPHVRKLALPMDETPAQAVPIPKQPLALLDESSQQEHETETPSAQAEEQLSRQPLSSNEAQKHDVSKNKRKSKGKRCKHHPHIKLREQKIHIAEGKVLHISCPACCVENKSRRRRNSRRQSESGSEPIARKSSSRSSRTTTLDRSNTR